jgi:hypothetical protein
MEMSPCIQIKYHFYGKIENRKAKQILFSEWVPVGGGRFKESEYGGNILYMCV